MLQTYLGIPLREQPVDNERYRKKSEIPSSLDLTGLEDYIIQLYPRVTQLGRTGFQLRKSTKRRQLIPVNGTSVAELRVELGRSQLFVLPNRDLLATVCQHSI